MDNPISKSHPSRRFAGAAIDTLLLALAIFNAGLASAQAPVTGLSEVQRAAVELDPRAVQQGILQQGSDLRLAALRTQNLPQLALRGQATHQSAVATVPIRLPNGEGVPAPSKTQFGVEAELAYSLYDGGSLRAQSDLERASLAEQVSGLAVSRYPRVQVATDTYFAVLLAEASVQTIALSLEDLAARRELTAKYVEGGTALPSALAQLDAQAILLEQSRDEASAQAAASREFLRKLTGLPLPDSVALPLPSLGTIDVESAQLERPELEAYAKTRDRVATEAHADALGLRPTLEAFAQGGVSQPNKYNFFETGLSPYGLVGVRATWRPFDYGATKKRAAAAQLAAETADSEEASFRDELERSTTQTRYDIARLEGTSAQDSAAIALNAQVLATVSTQFEEGVVTADVYTDALTDLASARLTAARHRIELERARASLLTALGTFPAQTANQ